MSKQENSELSELNTEQSQLKDPGFWQEIWLELQLVWRLMRDPAVPIYLKLIPVAAVVYLLVPLDLLPDALIGLGQLDDLTALLVGMRTFIRMAPQHLVTEHRNAIRIAAGYAVSEEEIKEKIIIDG